MAIDMTKAYEELLKLLAGNDHKPLMLLANGDSKNPDSIAIRDGYCGVVVIDFDRPDAAGECPECGALASLKPASTGKLTVGAIRAAIAGLPDDAPIHNDVMEGPDEWMVNIVGVEGGLPEHWQGVSNAKDIVPGLWIHTEIVPMDDDDDVCDECGETAPELAEALEGPWHKASCSLFVAK